MTEMHPNHPRYKGVPINAAVYKAQATGFQDDPYVLGWKDGVDEAVETGKEPDVKLDTAVDLEFVRAFTSILQDNPDAARERIRALSARDRAVLSFHLHELSRIVDEEETFRTTADRRAARDMAGLD